MSIWSPPCRGRCWRGSRPGRGGAPRPAERLYDCSAEDLSDFLAFLDNICSFVGTPEELAEAAEHAALESGRSISCTAR